MSEAGKPLIRLFMLVVLVSSFWLLPAAFAEPESSQEERKMVVLVAQAETPSGSPSVELRCDPVILLAANEFGGLTCTLKNNTTKNITATNFEYSILIDRNDASRRLRGPVAHSGFARLT